MEDKDKINPVGNGENNAQNNIEPTQNNIAPISVRLPTFWPKSIATWFVLVEAQFATNRITSDSSKFNYVLAALPIEIADSIMDFLENLPEKELYKNLKETLINRNSISVETKIRQLISDEQIGDRKPSEFYRCLKQLAGTSASVGEDFIKKLWLGRLPNLINIALIPQSDKSTSQLLETADRIWDAMQNTSASVSSISKPSTSNIKKQPDPDLKTLYQEISELKNSIANLKFDNRADRGRQRSRSRSRSKSRNRFNPNGALCFYHYKFGNKAQKCTQPCKFKISQSDNPNKVQNSKN